MKNILYILILITTFSFAQEDKNLEDVKHIYQGNVELKENRFVNAEAEYRKAISENAVNATSKFNLGNAYYQNKKTKEAVARYIQAQKVAKTKDEKHQAFHNMGNSFMQEKKFDLAIEAYKNALRNNPTDDETRYNLALAKQEKEKQDQQNDQNKDKNKDNKDKKDQNKDQKEDKKDKEGDDKKDNKDKEGDKDKKKDDKGNEDEKKDNKNGDKKDPKNDEKEKKKPQPKPGQLSPQQVQSLLEAMNNQEKKLQEKLNAKKAKGVPVQNEKDW